MKETALMTRSLRARGAASSAFTCATVKLCHQVLWPSSVHTGHRGSSNHWWLVSEFFLSYLDPHQAAKTPKAHTS